MDHPPLLDAVPHPAVVSDPSQVLGRHFSDLVDERTLRAIAERKYAPRP